MLTFGEPFFRQRFIHSLVILRYVLCYSKSIEKTFFWSFTCCEICLPHISIFLQYNNTDRLSNLFSIFAESTTEVTKAGKIIICPDFSIYISFFVDTKALTFAVDQ